METRIERATPQQHDKLTQIAHAAKRHWGYPERWIEIWKEALTITPEFISNNLVYASVVGGEVAGFYALTEAGGKLSLEHMWVDPARIGAGVGRKLFDHALKVAAGLNASSIEIESDPNAEGFYRRMGARRVGEVSSEIDGQPRVLPLLAIDIRR
jgi:GNAT superfamily N-acetyltransferase